MSFERAEAIGKSVGYIVRFDSTVPQSFGAILFCTIGKFYNFYYVYSNPDTNTKYTNNLKNIYFYLFKHFNFNLKYSIGIC